MAFEEEHGLGTKHKQMKGKNIRQQVKAIKGTMTDVLKPNTIGVKNYGSHVGRQSNYVVHGEGKTKIVPHKNTLLKGKGSEVGRINTNRILD